MTNIDKFLSNEVNKEYQYPYLRYGSSSKNSAMKNWNMHTCSFAKIPEVDNQANQDIDTVRFSFST